MQQEPASVTGSDHRKCMAAISLYGPALVTVGSCFLGPAPPIPHHQLGLRQCFGSSLHLHHVQRGHILLLLLGGLDTRAGLDLQGLDIGLLALLHPDNLPFMVQGQAGRCPKPWEVSHTLKEAPSSGTANI